MSPRRSAGRTNERPRSATTTNATSLHAAADDASIASLAWLTHTTGDAGMPGTAWPAGRLFCERGFPCLHRLAVSLGGGNRRMSTGVDAASMIVSQSMSANSQNRAVIDFTAVHKVPRVG
jgi:hypothetical protein